MEANQEAKSNGTDVTFGPEPSGCEPAPWTVKEDESDYEGGEEEEEEKDSSAGGSEAPSSAPATHEHEVGQIN